MKEENHVRCVKSEALALYRTTVDCSLHVTSEGVKVSQRILFTSEGRHCRENCG